MNSGGDDRDITPAGFPHSGIPGSKHAAAPRAYRSLPRPSSPPAPRHPPYALSSLTIKFAKSKVHAIAACAVYPIMCQMIQLSKNLVAPTGCDAQAADAFERTLRVQGRAVPPEHPALRSQLVEVSGIEPLTPACKAGALPAELYPRASNRTPEKLVGLGRFELPTSRLSGVRSSQLSYRPTSLRRIRQRRPGESRYSLKTK